MPATAYAIGDIHGRLDALQRVHRLIAEDRARHRLPEAPVIHLGDLVDRGPDSAGVIALLSEGRAAGAPWIVLRGNHDRMMELFVTDPDRHDPMLRPGYTWLHEIVGGKETLASYGIDPRSGADWRQLSEALARRMPPAHLDFLRAMPASHRAAGCIFAHAGLRPGVALADQTEDDLLWIRAPFHQHRGPHEALVIHGHTVVDRVTHYGNRVNIDTGAGYGRPVSAIVIENGRISVLTDEGRRPLPAP